MEKFEDFRRLLREDRSVRRFRQSYRISRGLLEELVNLTRYCASGRNAQPLRYRIINAPEDCEKIYPLLKWAGYYADWDGPAEEERPVAYLVQCLDTHYGANCLCDDGLELQALTLGATALGLGGCIIKAFDVAGMKKALNLDERYEPRYVLALGEPIEMVRLEDMDSGDDADFRYYRTPDGVHHVPKRSLSDRLI